MPREIVYSYDPVSRQQQQPPQPPLPQQDHEQQQQPTADGSALHATAPRTAPVPGSRLEKKQQLPPNSHKTPVPPVTFHPQLAGAALSLETAALSLNSASQRDVEQWCRRLAACAAHAQQGVDRAGLAARIARKVGALPPACREGLAHTCAAQLDDGLRAALTRPPAVVRGHVDAMLLLVSAGVVPALVVLRAAAWLGDDPQGPGVADALVEFTDALTRRSLGELHGAVPLLARGLDATREHVPHELCALVDLSLGKLRRAFCNGIINKRLVRRERYVEGCRALYERGRARVHAAFSHDDSLEWLLRQLFEQVACFGATTVPLEDLLVSHPDDAIQRHALWRAAGILEAAGIVRRSAVSGVQAVAFALHSRDAPMHLSTREMLMMLSHIGAQRGSGMYTAQQIDEARAVATAAGLITIAPIDADLPTPFVFAAPPRLPLVFSSQAAAAAVSNGIHAALAGLRVFSPPAAALTVARLDDALTRLTEHGTTPAMSLKEIAVSAAFAAISENPETKVASNSGITDVAAAASAVAAFVSYLGGSLTDASAAALLRSSVPPSDICETDPAYVAAERKFVFSGLVVAGLVSRGLVANTVAVEHLRWAVGRSHTAPAYHFYSHALALASKLNVIGCLTSAEFDAHAAWLEHGCLRHRVEESTAYWAARTALAGVKCARVQRGVSVRLPMRAPDLNATPGAVPSPRRKARFPPAALPTVPSASDSPPASPLRRDPREMGRSPLKVWPATSANSERQSLPGAATCPPSARKPSSALLDGTCDGEHACTVPHDA